MAGPGTDPLLQPYRLRHLTLRNRLLSTSHEPAYSEDGLPKQRYRRYHEEKARGGIGLTMIGGSSIVAPDSPPAFGNLHVYRDEIVPWFREIADACHGHGAAVMCQITHLGRRTSWATGDWLPVLSPSPIREPAHRAHPKAAEDWDIDRIVAAYAAAAERCKAGGLDGVEIEAYGHLIDAFWSPATNRRDDDHGGSLENRMRFGRAVIAAMRQAVGPDYIIGIRMVADEAWAPGLSRADGLAIAGRLIADGRIDFINVIKGHIDSDAALSQVIPNAGTPAGPHLDLARDVRRAARAAATAAGATLPIFHAARINDVATARHAVATGILDLVGMTRAHLADPHIGAKIAAGDEHRIRPCVGAGYCIDRIYQAGEALCIHNPATGREAVIPQVVPRSDGPARRVVVVGAGPAGLEAARVAAERGHRVVLFEAADKPGGQVRIAAGLARRRELIGIIDWRAAECDRLGVDMRCNRYAEADMVLAEAPDVVLVATGGLPHTGFLAEGAALVTTGWDILTGQARPGQSVLLFDDNGAHPGVSAAEAIARSGASLDYVTPERIVAPEVGGTNHPAYMKAFADCGVRLTLNERLTAVRRSGNRLTAVLYNEYAGIESRRTVDQVVVETGTLPLDELYWALRPLASNGGAVDYQALIDGRPQQLVRRPDGAFQLFRIGDAVESRNIHAAVYDGIRFAMTL